MKSTHNILCSLLSILLFSMSLNAQDGADTPEPLETDRPDATEASSVVPKGALQIETGGFYESYEENNFKIDRTAYNFTLLRYGLLENFELRLGWNYEHIGFSLNDQKLTESLNGLSPLLAGMKVYIAEEKNGMPEIALIGHVFLPFSASSDFKPQTTGADFRFSISHTLNEKSSIGYNIGAQWGNDSPEIAYIYTVAYGYSLSDKFGFYVELYGDFPENSSSNHLWDAGFTYLMLPNLQFDIYAGTSITDGQDILLGAGLSYRILK